MHSPSSWGLDINHSQLKSSNLTREKSLCEDISNLEACSSVSQLEYPFFDLFFDEVKIKFHVFGSIKMNWILCNTDYYLIIIENMY